MEVNNYDGLGNQSLPLLILLFKTPLTTPFSLDFRLRYLIKKLQDRSEMYRQRTTHIGLNHFRCSQKHYKKQESTSMNQSDFEAGGYKWRLVIYPNGNPKRDANDHLSLYLAISETNDLPIGWEVHAFFKYLVFDQIRDKFLVVQDVGERRFHAIKTEWGIPKLLSLSTFSDPAFGYLIDDCCVFGVDVFVIKREGKGASESVSMIKEPKNGTFTWKVANFSELKEERHLSEGFTVGGNQWNVSLYPKGDSRVEGNDKLSLFLSLVNNSVVHRPGWKVYMKFKLRIKDQLHDKHKELIDDGDLFCESAKAWGWPNFISLSDLNDVEKGFLVKDTLIVEAEITLISVVNYFVEKKN